MSIVQLVPNGTVTTFGTVSASAGTIHDALAAPSGEYVMLDTWATNVAPAYVLLDMSTFTLPPGGVLLGIVNYISVSGQTQAGGPGPYMYMWRNVSNARTKTAATTGGSYVTYSNTDCDNAGVPPSTQADLDSYQLYVYLEPEDAFVYVQMAYILVTYIGLPSIGAVAAPSGAITAVSVPAVSWTFSKDTSSPAGQAKYQVKVFTAAQYGIGGFDPATSPFTYDSGVVASATSSHSIPVHTLRPGTYRCYVRAATTNAGQDQWAPYKFSSFTLTLKSINTWDGAAFSLKPVKIWNGTAFVEAAGVKYWNGTAFVDAVNG